MGVDQVKNIILVSSGKGGVGKSTVAANLAAALANQGFSVGVFDADIYGPSQFMMFGLENNQPFNLTEDMKYTLPFDAHGVKVMSIASSIRDDQAVSWRGPMATVALKNLLLNTQWNELDYLVIDMPPGTGDIQISLCELLPKAQAVIVTTPQDVALLDCKKGIELFVQRNIKILGIVENMSGYLCNHCGNIDHIFGENGANNLSDKYQVPVLGKIPLQTTIRINADQGKPIAFDSGAISEIYKMIAEKISESI
jgi:ATP-binding protein involved in chromosome partitioning